MPLYEYQSKEDGKVIELLRPMAEADRPVEDPEGKGRTFVARQSTFAAGAATGASGRRLSLRVGAARAGRTPGRALELAMAAVCRVAESGRAGVMGRAETPLPSRERLAA